MGWAAPIAVIAFLVVITLIGGLWWLSATTRNIRDRLTYDARRPQEEQGIIREDPGV